ncbi:MAG: hypothetical protein LBF60_03045 [Treponema sp.]|nr:hypothetical protein [Treponema sp.]
MTIGAGQACPCECILKPPESPPYGIQVFIALSTTAHVIWRNRWKRDTIRLFKRIAGII